jgi:hypothetical protein
MFCRLALAAIFLCLWLQQSGSAADFTGESWDNLRQLTHRATFIFMSKDRSCVAGTIDEVSDDAVVVVVARKTRHSVTVHRPDLLRVNYGTWGAGVLFSSRSSWLDLSALISRKPANFHPKLSIQTKSGGRRYEGKLASVSDSILTLDSNHKVIDIPKAEIATASYIIPRPLSSSAAYADDELAFLKIFDPELWPKLLGFQGSLNVRLFDAVIPEDDSPVACGNDPFGLRPQGPDLTQH